jgi:hypothetical protein
MSASKLSTATAADSNRQMYISCNCQHPADRGMCLDMNGQSTRRSVRSPRTDQSPPETRRDNRSARIPRWSPCLRECNQAWSLGSSGRRDLLVVLG